MPFQKIQFASICALLVGLLSASYGGDASLKSTYGGQFLVGAALNDAQVSGKNAETTALIASQFSALTPENAMKWESLHPAEGKYDFSKADRYVAFGEKHGMAVIGHTLVWHVQTPAWVFKNTDGTTVSREALLARMRDHIHTVVGRYKGRILGWDVVNEALNEDGSLRDSPWKSIIGDDYIIKAFQFAHEADPKAELYYNDFSIENPTKRKGAIELLKQLKAAGVPITGVGIQEHVSLTWPSLTDLDETITEIGKLGLKVMITELDVDVLPSRNKSTGSAEITHSEAAEAALNPYVNGLPDDMQKKLAQRYAELFSVYVKHADTVTRVTLWGVADGDSWLNGWPIKGRTSYPLLFDRGGKPKPAFHSVIQMGQAMGEARSLGFWNNIVVEQSAPSGSFPLVTENTEAPLWYDVSDFTGVVRAVGDLQADIERVSGRKPKIASDETVPSTRPVIIGTVGKSAIIDSLVKSGKLDVSDLAGKWESFVITVVDKPAAGIEQALVIAGSDKRGTIYGIYELSEQLGVSPWYWWADVAPKKRAAAYVIPGRFASGEPAVKYRGIFINDEEPAFGPWAREKFGGVNSKMYAHVFELILRLRGNYLWPAMWGKAFNEDDPLNPKVADDYGIVMGTSHHEPMMRAQKEWTKRKADLGEWNYATNGKVLYEFFREGIERNKSYDNMVTIGMRGDGDEPMAKDGDMAANIALLERIVADQRKLLAEIVNPDVAKVPQMWALYKEVAEYYNAGMKIPDDITLLWCDDNWGNNRRLPTAEERKRSGGAGIYYHFDYVGTPRSYRWLNTNPLPKIWEQMNMAYDYGVDRIWIVNVGDLKPMELPIEFFLRFAWNPRALPKEKIAEFTRRWAEREFGPKYADDIADIVSKYAKYNAWRKPELLEPTTFSVVNYHEAERVLASWQAIVAKAEKIAAQLPPESRDAFYQLVLHPTKASATVAEMYIMTGVNRLYTKQKRATANLIAQHAQALFKLDQSLADAYHQLNGGKWNHMMAQPHIGYVKWSAPKENEMPSLGTVDVPNTASMGVAVEGSEASWPGSQSPATLPAFDSINQQRYMVEVFKRGSQTFEFSISANQPWVKLSMTKGIADRDQRIWVTIDWEKAPVGFNNAVINVTRTGSSETVPIRVNATRSDKFTRENVDAFGGLTGPTAIAASDATRNIPAGGVRWEIIPDYGRGQSGVSVFPTTAASVQPPKDSPCLEYSVLIPKAGEIRVDLYTGPTLNVQPGRGVRVAVSFDDQPPQVVDAFSGQFYADPSKRGDTSSPAIRDWAKWVKDNSRTLKTKHKIATAGVHTLKVWMVDPGVVLEKLVVYSDELKPSYFGPPSE